MSYYNTTYLSGLPLSEAIKSAKSHELAVMVLFHRVKKPMTPREVLDRLKAHNRNKFWEVEVHSIRARMTTLANNGHLNKLGLVKGTKGRPVNQWALPVAAESSVQTSMF